MTAKVTALPNVNLRVGPGTNRPVIKTMPVNTSLTIIDGLTVTDSTYTWQALTLLDNTIGWCVQSYGGMPVFKDPPVIKGSRWGFHALNGGHSNDIIGIANRLNAAGHRMGAVLVAGEKPMALLLQPCVERVIFRIMNVLPYSPTYDPNPTTAYLQGRQWVKDRYPAIQDLPASIFIQYANEGKWSPTEADFWRGVLDENNGARKLALFADAIGNPDDEGGSTAEQKWATRIPLLRRAKTEGHIYAFHVYSAPGTPAGMLTPVNQRQNYETRFRRLRAVTPVDAQIPFICTEAAREYINGTFDGVTPTVEWLKAIHAEYAGDDVPVCAYTAGVWKSSSIDEALPQIEALYRGTL